MHRAGLRGDQDDLSFHIFAGVIRILFRSVADVDEICRDVGAFAVFGEGDGFGFVAGDFYRRLIVDEFPEFGEFGVPRLTRALRAVISLSIGEKLEDLRVGESVGAGAFENDFRGGVKSLRAALAMEAGDPFEIAFGDFAGEFLSKGTDIFFGEQRRLGSGGESSGEEESDGELGAD